MTIWLHSDIELLKEVYPHFTTWKIAHLFPTDVHGIIAKASSLKIKKQYDWRAYSSQRVNELKTWERRNKPFEINLAKGREECKES